MLISLCRHKKTKKKPTHLTINASALLQLPAMMISKWRERSIKVLESVLTPFVHEVWNRLIQLVTILVKKPLCSCENFHLCVCFFKCCWSNKKCRQRGGYKVGVEKQEGRKEGRKGADGSFCDSFEWRQNEGWGLSYSISCLCESVCTCLCLRMGGVVGVK